MSQRLAALFSAVLASLLVSCAAPGKPANQAAGRCSYEVTVSIGASQELADYTSQVTYCNTSGQALDKLVVHYKPGPGKEPLQAHLVRGGIAETEPLRASPWTSDGAPVADYVEVHLPEPLAPGQAVTLQMRSTAAVENMYGIKRLEGCWHPKVVRFDKGRWQAGVDEFATYRVTVDPVPTPYLPASGALVASTQESDGTWKLTFASGIIPDFALVFTAVDKFVTRASGDVAIQCFYVHDKEAAEEMLSIAGDVVSFYRELYGFYPDSVLNIIAFDGNGFGGGPIGSNIVFVNNTFGVSRDNTKWAIAHEIAHEYWGWNSVTDLRSEWLSLGMGLWTDAQYTDAIGVEGQGPNMLADYLNAAKRGLDTRLAAPTPGGSGQRMGENSLAHGKGFQVIKMLEYMVGKEASCGRSHERCSGSTRMT